MRYSRALGRQLVAFGLRKSCMTLSAKFAADQYRKGTVPWRHSFPYGRTTAF